MRALRSRCPRGHEDHHALVAGWATSRLTAGYHPTCWLEVPDIVAVSHNTIQDLIRSYGRSLMGASLQHLAQDGRSLSYPRCDDLFDDPVTLGVLATMRDGAPCLDLAIRGGKEEQPLPG